MKRFVLFGALVAGACGSATDDRPATLAYITETILAPSCASAECHSAFKRQVGDQFDTPDAARLSIVANVLVAYPDETRDEVSAESSRLIQTLTVGAPSILSPSPTNLVRMPYDAPIPDADVELIRRWILAGVPGAQCVANAQGRGCQNETVANVTVSRVVECVDGNAGTIVQTCPADQFCDFYKGNGQCL
jgi:hypothetical protein